MTGVLIDLVNYAGLILIPMIPALIILKILPSKAFVTGILKDWKINLTGGFAAYFALLLLLLPIFWPRADQEVWKVVGTIKFESTGNSGPPPSNVKFTVNPPNPVISNAGDFDMSIAVSRRGGQREFPNFTIEHPGYVTESVILDKDQSKGIISVNKEYEIDYLLWKRKIVIVGSIPLKEE